MDQNTSAAVMQQRHEPTDSLDDFPTPPWATRALVELVLPYALGIEPGRALALFSGMVAREPTCNRGYMARALGEYFARVVATDVHDYGYAGMAARQDFLSEPDRRVPDWYVFNPPFARADQFILRALDYRPRCGVAAFVRSGFLEGVTRYETLFSRRPPTVVAQFVERVILAKGVLRNPALTFVDPISGQTKRPTTATAYSWLVWADGRDPLPPYWIPPARAQLERAHDYEDHDA